MSKIVIMVYQNGEWLYLSKTNKLVSSKYSAKTFSSAEKAAEFKSKIGFLMGRSTMISEQ